MKLAYANLNSNRNKELSPEYKLWVSIFKTMNTAVSIVDRSQTVSCPINYTVFDRSKLPLSLYTNHSYRDIVSNRCEELMSLGKPLRVLWSGGIDSTLIVSTLLKNYDKTKLREQVKIILTYDSLVENKNFYINHIAPNFDIVGGETVPYQLFDGQGPIVTGEHNDQVFGSDLLRDFIIQMGPGAVSRTFSEDIIRAYYTKKGLTEEEFNYWFNNVTHTARTLGVPLIVCSDYFWWFNFCFKWQSVLLRIHCITPKLLADKLKENYGNCIHFYCTDAFQQWSVSNPQHRHFDVWNNYKRHAKELIYELDKDEDYLLNKLKKPSLHNIYTGRFVYEGIDEKYNLIKTIQIEDYLK